MTFSQHQLDQLWTCWGRGEPSRLIARSLGCHATKVRRVLAASGGVRPPVRRRRDGHLSSMDREEISRGIAAGLTARAIAARMGRSASTISREIARNGGRSTYRARNADAAAWQRARRPKTTRFAADPVLCGLVQAKLVQDWSPQQIAVWLRREHPSDPATAPVPGQGGRPQNAVRRSAAGVGNPDQHPTPQSPRLGLCSLSLPAPSLIHFTHLTGRTRRLSSAMAG